MTELTSGVNPLFLRDDELRQGIEFFLIAYKDFTADADRDLARLGLGRAHHRILYFVGRSPGIAVGELLAVLGITKQSLSRNMAELVARGLIDERPGPADRRRKLLTLTSEGETVESRLTERQRARIARAYREAGAEAVEGFRKVVLGMIDENGRARFAAHEREEPRK
ncbi:MAG: MarR family winged helix-turn-helix transcriptional regulator [Alphaproteobacteria bacterium]